VASYTSHHHVSTKNLSLPYEVSSSVLYNNKEYEERFQTGKSNNPSAGNSEVWALERLEGQPRVGCRKTCGRGSKRAEIIRMGYSTRRVALRQGSCHFQKSSSIFTSGVQGQGSREFFCCVAPGSDCSSTDGRRIIGRFLRLACRAKKPLTMKILRKYYENTTPFSCAAAWRGL